MLQLFSQCRIWVHLIRIRSKGDDVTAVRAVFADFDEILEGDALALRKQRLDYFNSIAREPGAGACQPQSIN